MIYFRKLLEQHPDDPLLEVYWGRDAIGPRFMRLVAGDFLSNLRRGDLVTAARAWTNVLEVAASLKRRTRRRLRMVSPLISILFRMRFVSVPKLLLRYAIH
jgi:hypothetical protein